MTREIFKRFHISECRALNYKIQKTDNNQPHMA